MQHLPVPATGAAHSLDGWYHRGSPPSLHARVRYWPAKWGRSQNAAVDFHFPHHFILSEFRRKWTHVQNTIHCETWSSWIFLIICISELCNFFLKMFSAWTLWKRGCSAHFCTASASYWNVKWRDCTLKQMYPKAQGDHLWWCSHLCWSCPLTSLMLTISILRVRSECNGYKSLIALLFMIV